MTKSRWRLLPLLITLVSVITSAGAGEPDSLSNERHSVGSVLESDGLRFLRAAGHVFSAPARWEGRDWLVASEVAVGTAASTVLDEDVRRLMHRNRSDLSTGISDVSVEYGSGLNMLLLAAGGYAVGLASGDEWLRETALLTGTAILIAGSLSTVTKIMVGRSRPYMDRGHMSFKPLSFSTEDFVSFPSGHTVVAFAVSGVLAERIKNVWASIGLYGLAGATAWSRMYTDHHWVSDVVFGAALSVAVSRSLVQWHEGGEGTTGGGLTIAPRGDGLVILWIF